MGELLNRKNDGLAIDEKKARLMEMWQECAVYFQSLPASCAFGVQSFKRAASNNEGAAFLFLHVLFQSTISLLERPGLMRGREMEALAVFTPNVSHISASASRSIVDMISLAAQVDPKSFQASPYLDQLILPTGRAFIGEREAIAEAVKHCGYRTGISNLPPPSADATPSDHTQTARSDDEQQAYLHRMRLSVSENLHKCTAWLATLARFWGGASWPARALEQEAAGAELEPDVQDDDAMQAPLRDIELLRTWANDKTRQGRARTSLSGSKGVPTAAGLGGLDGVPHPGVVEGELAAGLDPSGGADSAASISALLAALNGSGSADALAGSANGEGDGGYDGTLGLALSGQLATSAEVGLQALVDFWAAEQAQQDRTGNAHQVGTQGGEAGLVGGNEPGPSSFGRPWPSEHSSSAARHLSTYSVAQDGLGEEDKDNPARTTAGGEAQQTAYPFGLSAIGAQQTPFSSGMDHVHSPQPQHGSNNGTLTPSQNQNHYYSASYPYNQRNNAQGPVVDFSALQLEKLLSTDLDISAMDPQQQQQPSSKQQ